MKSKTGYLLALLPALLMFRNRNDNGTLRLASKGIEYVLRLAFSRYGSEFPVP